MKNLILVVKFNKQEYGHLRKFEYAFGELLKGSEEWWSEQSIYKPLLIWSAIQEEAVGQRFVLKREIIGLDYEERLFSIRNSVEVEEVPFIHFPGHPIALIEEAKLIVKTFTWHKELERRQHFRTKCFWGFKRYTIDGSTWHISSVNGCGD